MHSAKDADNAVAGSMSMFKKIQEWCILNNTRVNINKTKHMIVGGNVKVYPLSESWENRGVITVENYTYLGANRDRKLNFEKIISNTIARA